VNRLFTNRSEWQRWRVWIRKIVC